MDDPKGPDDKPVRFGEVIRFPSPPREHKVVAKAQPPLPNFLERMGIEYAFAVSVFEEFAEGIIFEHSDSIKDFIQACLLAAHECIEDFDGKDVVNWLHSIAEKQLIALKNAPGKIDKKTKEALLAFNREEVHIRVMQEVFDVLHPLSQQLTPVQKEIVLMYFRFNKTFEEIAAELKTDEKNVQKELEDGLKELKVQIYRHGLVQTLFSVL